MEVSSFNPVDASKSIVDSVERYLKSTFNPRRSVIADEYLKALETSRDTNELGGSLFRQIRRSFASGISLQELHSNGIIHERLMQFMSNTPYVHQTKALQLTSKKRNIVIATGTGSGKTESFLMPIIDSLLKESDVGKLSPGIRAVIVYPMNALVADQLGRFREVMVKYPEITFGRFVGPTKQTNAEAVRENGERQFQENERPSRNEILDNPPHILITNYAMLERLMLLPKWQQLFTNKLKWIVMDEVHSYDGTKGIEISLLLRRLKVRTSDPEGVQCIAASATLGDGSKEDILRTCNFAAVLFGERFEEGDIILPEYSSEIPEEPLIDIFSKEEKRNLERYRNEEVGTYHLFVKNPGGAFICLSGDHFKDAPRMRLQQRKWCPECEGVSRLIELGACRACGIEYLIAKNVNGELMPVDEFDEAARYYRLINAQLPDWPVDQREIRNEILDDDDDDSNIELAASPESFWFCPSCSKLNTADKCNKCSRQLLVEVSEELTLSKNGKLCCNRCQSSGGRSAFGAVIRPVSGVDALTSVISTALYEHLPTNNRDGVIQGGRRKLLAFSDNRQDAAYFAPYLEDSYYDFLRRRIIFETSKKLEISEIQTAPFMMKDFAATMKRFHQIVGQEDGDSIWPWTWLRGELVAVDTQQSLSGTALLRWFVPESRISTTLSYLESKSIDRIQAFSLINALLESVAYDGAVELPDGVDASDPIFAPKEVLRKIYKTGKRPSNSAIAWTSSAPQGNKRTSMVERGLLVDKENATQILNGIWDSLLEDDVFNDEGAGLKTLSNKIWRIETLNTFTKIQNYCPVCRKFSWWSLPNGVCVQKNCDGLVIQLSSKSDNQFRTLYQSLPLASLSASEHTAQWTPEKAEKIQNQFINGEINVLSCSTTFEMGVDIGEVVAVLCRNVPPTPANYVQRAGRAGRRAGDRSLVVTFARKRSHDAQFATDPRRLINGRVPVPIINLENFDLVRRHIYALALSEFLRMSSLPGDTALSFFGENDSGEIASSNFLKWLKERPSSLQDSIKRLGLPSQTLEKIGFIDWNWVDLLSQPDENDRGGWLSVIEKTFTAEDKSLKDWIEELMRELNSSSSKSNKIIDRLKQANIVKENLQNRQLIELLANGGILPKYGFPVDVATLTPGYKSLQSGRGVGLELSRDLSLALTEYAPGSQVVAGGKLLTSEGVKRPSHIDFGSLRWVAITCDQCGWFFHKRAPFSDIDDEALPVNCGNCLVLLTSDKKRFFIEPRFGFIASIDSKSAGSKSRPRRIASAKTYLSTASGEDSNWKNRTELLSTSVSRDARLLTLSNSSYHLCQSCGYASPIPTRRSARANPPAATHEDPRREEVCTSKSRLMRTTFGHEYVTDVLRLKFRMASLPNCICGDQICLGALESAAAALVSGAVRILGIASYDLNSAVNSKERSNEHRLMLFDTTPGGAGLAQAADERLGDVITEAIRLSSDCQDCTKDSSCYSCIRTYGNQWRHEHLTRATALDVLNSLK